MCLLLFPSMCDCLGLLLFQAPVIDSCGSAGGRYPGQSTGGAGAQYQNTSLAKEGDAGSKLPEMPAQATWKAGASYEVGWTVSVL